ncbi:MAG: NAD(P)H-hydrate dehydratase [Nitrososphaeraceae archaeon]
MARIDVSSDFVKDLVPARLASSKKGDNGTVLVVGGNKIYHGAPILASLSALRSGTDLVYTAVPRSNIVTVRSQSPNIIALPLSTDQLTTGSANWLLSNLPKKPDAAAIGMGMTIDKPSALARLIMGLQSIGTKLLLDASALVPEILEVISGTNTIITPHPGEYKRIFEEDVGKSQNEQIANISRLSEKYGITIVLKGFTNFISSFFNKDLRVSLVNRTTPAMTVGGCGDVLSGLISGFLTKLSSFDASVLGIYFNGLAASEVYDQVGLHMVATDLLEKLPDVMKGFDKIDE